MVGKRDARKGTKGKGKGKGKDQRRAAKVQAESVPVVKESYIAFCSKGEADAGNVECSGSVFLSLKKSTSSALIPKAMWEGGHGEETESHKRGGAREVVGPLSGGRASDELVIPGGGQRESPSRERGGGTLGGPERETGKRMSKSEAEKQSSGKKGTTRGEEGKDSGRGEQRSGEERNNFYPKEVKLSHIVLYETKARFYLVGYNKARTTARIMKLDRTQPAGQLHIDVDPCTYSAKQMRQLILAIHDGNKATGGLKLIVHAHGILGFMRFTLGYYIMLVTKKRKVGTIGPHSIYGLDSTAYVYIPRRGAERTAQDNKYKTLFFGLEMTDFYFSYTYDLTRTLQFNMTCQEAVGVDKRFVWNHFLLKPLRHVVDPQSPWLLPMIHGYFAQTNVNTYGHLIKMTIIARRSRYFAGTRYLKRGVNTEGMVANDVETEQLVEDCNFASLRNVTRFSSYVQIRGSIPVFWGQEPRTLTPKPPIYVQRCDPFYAATKLHFKDLYLRFGHPVVVLNLVKQHEKKPRESILRREFQLAVEQINTPMPDELRLCYMPLDFSRAAKSETVDIITEMSRIAERSLAKTGFFHSGTPIASNELRRDRYCPDTASKGYEKGFLARLQTGVLRSNCIDSLDRTNAAQFVVGTVALGYQLHALGLAESTAVDFEDKVVSVLMDLFQDMGNTLAMQYGGSHLAHTMSTYKGSTKTLSTQSRDMITSLQRYYSNSFIDKDKQDSINIFLGNFIPAQEKIQLWDLETDYYLHIKTRSSRSTATEQWWVDAIAEHERRNRRKPLGNVCHDFAPWNRGHRYFDDGEECAYSEYFDQVYSVRRITSFDRKLRGKHIKTVHIEDSGHGREPAAFYGLSTKKWITLQKGKSSDVGSLSASGMDDIQRARHRAVDRDVLGPTHNALAYYEISLSIPDSTWNRYHKYIALARMEYHIPTPPSKAPNMPSAKSVLLKRFQRLSGSASQLKSNKNPRLASLARRSNSSQLALDLAQRDGHDAGEGQGDSGAISSSTATVANYASLSASDFDVRMVERQTSSDVKHLRRRKRNLSLTPAGGQRRDIQDPHGIGASSSSALPRLSALMDSSPFDMENEKSLPAMAVQRHFETVCCMDLTVSISDRQVYEKYSTFVADVAAGAFMQYHGTNQSDLNCYINACTQQV